MAHTSFIRLIRICAPVCEEDRTTAVGYNEIFGSGRVTADVVERVREGNDIGSGLGS